MATRPFDVQRLDHVALRVRDLDRSEAFYREVPGRAMVRRRDDLGLRHLRAGASMIDQVAVDDTLGRRGGTAPGPQGRNLDHPLPADRVIRRSRHHRAASGARARAARPCQAQPRRGRRRAFAVLRRSRRQHHRAEGRRR
ncbi:MAG: VOC family protein [Thermomonas haemolytica]